jgi:hypothetical protein
MVRTSSSIDRPWRAARMRNCALVRSSRLRMVRLAMSDFSLALKALPAMLAPLWLLLAYQ